MYIARHIYSYLWVKLWQAHLLLWEIIEKVSAWFTQVTIEKEMDESWENTVINSQEAEEAEIEDDSYQTKGTYYYSHIGRSYKTLWDAMMNFRDITSSGRIWDFYFPVANRWNKSIVQIYMKYKWILTEPFWELSIASWK